MPVTRNDDATTWDLPGTHFTGLASPSRGDSRDISVWRLVLDPYAEGGAHHVTRTEVFAVVAGTALVRIDGRTETIGRGDTLVVPPDIEFALGNPAEDAFEAIVCLPAGGQAALPGGAPFTPQWAT